MKNDLILHPFHESFLPLAGLAGMVPVPDPVSLQLFLRGQDLVLVSFSFGLSKPMHAQQQQTSKQTAEDVVCIKVQ